MQRTLTSEKLPIRLWLADIDADTLQQAKNLANLPCIFHHVAIMPDAHVGYGMPIGGVAAALAAVIPNAVGVDIGCGVAACRTSLTALDNACLKRLLGEVRRHIPLGFQHHKKPQPHSLMPDIDQGDGDGELTVVEAEYESGRLQLGTLGGGNHFIEVQRGDDGFLWLMIHSGSRNLGYRVASHYNRVAAQVTGRHKLFPLSWQLDYLKVDSGEGRSYLREMGYCVRFAAANRRAMMDRVQELLADLQPGVEFTAFFDVAHNYAAVEEHFGRPVVVHRKGATRAAAGEIGLIPGSQGSHSYVVRGLGNAESFSSCSHGAGRRLGRKQAQRQLDLRAEIARLEERGILHAIRHRKDLEEAAGAYKDIDEVMANQKDLVDIVTALHPLAVVKG